MFTRQFWTMTAERLIKTFAQTMAGVLVAGGTAMSVVGWKAALSAAALAAVVSVLTSIGSLKIGPADSPSVVRTEPAPGATTAAQAPTAQPVPAAPVTTLGPASTAPAQAEAA
jgi:r1t holin